MHVVRGAAKIRERDAVAGIDHKWRGTECEHRTRIAAAVTVAGGGLATDIDAPVPRHCCAAAEQQEHREAQDFRMHDLLSAPCARDRGANVLLSGLSVTRL